MDDMIAAGVNVALGTDSFVCLDTPDRISVLDEMRLLHRRDGTDPATLLRMATINGARALGFDEHAFCFAPGCTAGVLAVSTDKRAGSPGEALRSVLQRSDAPQWVVGPIPAGDFVGIVP